MRRARIERLVNAMANTHDLFLLGKLSLGVSIDVFLVPNFLQHVNHAFVGTAM